MSAYKVAVIGGDGIGPEVTTEAIKVIAAAGVQIATTEFDLGGARYMRDGRSCRIRPSTICASLKRSCSAL
jgi:3-isopropylmalate dehydrogenase